MKRSALKRSLVPMKRSSLKRSRGKRRAAQAPITGMARGELCLIRLAAICNGNPETTVPCHLRLSGLSGAGYISDPFFIAFGCSSCHAWVDSHYDPETKLAFYEGIFRTQARLKELGVLRIGVEAAA